MSDQWYYAAGSEQKGPISPDQMRALVATGTINPTTLVWTQSMANWLPLGQSPLAGQMGHPTSAPVAGFPPQSAQWASPAMQGVYGNSAASPGFGDAIKICFSKYATFAGRASRPEFWWFYLFYMIVLVATSAVDGVITASGALPFSPFSTIAVFAMLLPQLSATVRRLHDTDRSGWWYWIILVPLVGVIALIVFLCQKGTPAPNRFG